MINISMSHRKASWSPEAEKLLKWMNSFVCEGKEKQTVLNSVTFCPSSFFKV